MATVSFLCPLHQYNYLLPYVIYSAIYSAAVSGINIIHGQCQDSSIRINFFLIIRILFMCVGPYLVDIWYAASDTFSNANKV